MSIAYELGQSAREIVDLGKETGGGIISSITDRNRSAFQELFKAGTGILGISLKTVARIAGVLGLGAAKTVGKAAAALPIVPLPGKR